LTSRPVVPLDGAVPGESLGMARRVAQAIRLIIGAPDYAAYLRHVREAHPERTPLSEPEFQQDRLTARYSRPGSRCC
jgi:uncharacterized short protein YbdD (DUF466 family)